MCAARIIGMSTVPLSAGRRTVAQTICLFIGVAFVIVAIWGFVDGEHVLIFHVNTAHNLVHLASGIAALICGLASATAARVFCLVFGSVYALVALLGMANVAAVNELLHLNDADDALHAVIALLLLAAPFIGRPAATARVID